MINPLNSYLELVAIKMVRRTTANHLFFISFVFLLNVSTRFVRLAAVCSLIPASLLQNSLTEKQPDTFIIIWQK